VKAYFRVRNWYKYQDPDQKGNTIIIHEKILADKAILQLRDRDRWHFVAILSLARRLRNKIRNDEVEIADEISATDPINLSAMFRLKLIEPYSSENVAKDRKRYYTSDVKRYEFAERVRKNLWNKYIKKNVRSFSPRIVSLLWKRREEYGDRAIARVVLFRAASYFLSRVYAHGEGASPDRVFAPELFVKILNGQFNDWKVDATRDSFEAFRSCKMRGLDSDRVSPPDALRYLSEDCFRANLRAIKAGVDISNLPPSDMIKWYEGDAGKHPAVKGEQ
jgi:hypothetical protein